MSGATAASASASASATNTDPDPNDPQGFYAKREMRSTDTDTSSEAEVARSILAGNGGKEMDSTEKMPSWKTMVKFHKFVSEYVPGAVPSPPPDATTPWIGYRCDYRDYGYESLASDMAGFVDYAHKTHGHVKYFHIWRFGNNNPEGQMMIHVWIFTFA